MNDIEIEMQVKYVNLDLPMYEHQIRRTVYKITLNCIKKKKKTCRIRWARTIDTWKFSPLSNHSLSSWCKALAATVEFFSLENCVFVESNIYYSFPQRRMKVWTNVWFSTLNNLATKTQKRGKEKSIRDIRLTLRYFRFQLSKFLRICVQLVFITLKA